jgi:hypothetical protein
VNGATGIVFARGPGDFALTSGDFARSSTDAMVALRDGDLGRKSTDTVGIGFGPLFEDNDDAVDPSDEDETEGLTAAIAFATRSLRDDVWYEPCRNIVGVVRPKFTTPSMGRPFAADRGPGLFARDGGPGERLRTEFFEAGCDGRTGRTFAATWGGEVLPPIASTKVVGRGDETAATTAPSKDSRDLSASRVTSWGTMARREAL